MLRKAVESSDVKGLICKTCAEQHTQVYLSQRLALSIWKLSVEELQNNPGLKEMHTVKSLRRNLKPWKISLLGISVDR